MSKTTYLKNEDGMVYEQGYSDCWYSYERRVKEGTVRVIDRKSYYAGSIYTQGPFAKPQVVWSPIKNMGLPLPDQIIQHEIAMAVKSHFHAEEEKTRKEQDNG